VKQTCQPHSYTLPIFILLRLWTASTFCKQENIRTLYVHTLPVREGHVEAYPAPCLLSLCVGLAITIYIRCIHGIFGRKITKYTVIYGVYKRLWPTLVMRRMDNPALPRPDTLPALFCLFLIYLYGPGETYTYTILAKPILIKFWPTLKPALSCLFLIYLYGPGQPLTYTVLAKPILIRFWPTLNLP